MALKRLTLQEFLEMFDPSVHDGLKELLVRYQDAVAVVVFYNKNMWSSQLGMRTGIVVGPSNTFKSVEACEGKHIHDLPSQRQYASAWIAREDLLA